MRRGKLVEEALLGVADNVRRAFNGRYLAEDLMHKQVCSLWQRDVGGKTLDNVNHVGKSALTHYLQTCIERKD